MKAHVDIAFRGRFGLGLLLSCMLAWGAACSSENESANGVDERADDAIMGRGQRPPDGAPGACCEPSAATGCGDVGGYRADGDCTQGSICDNMCEMRIVDDEHGCRKMVYKTPPVTTTYASSAPCTDPVFNGGDVDAGADAGQ